jgi:hypothetical protein
MNAIALARASRCFGLGTFAIDTAPARGRLSVVVKH